MPDFAKIRARAAQRKGGEAALSSLLGAAPDNASLANVTDNRILSTMAERIFSAGFVWSVIEQKWPGFEEAFLGFEPKRLLFQPDDFWYGLANDKRIVRNPQKIKSIQENAAFVERVSKEHGSFGTFLSRWPKDDQIGLMAYLAKHGSRLGGNTGQYFLRWVGWDAFILSQDLVAALRDAGAGCRLKPELEEGPCQNPGTDERLGGTDGACVQASLANPCHVDRREQFPRSAAGIYGRVVAQSNGIAG